MADLILAPPVNDTRGKAWRAIIDQRLKRLDVSPAFIFNIDALPDSAVLAMAWQWDVLDPSWQLGAQLGEDWDALTDIDSLSDIDALSSPHSQDGPSDFDTYRALIKLSVPLHRVRGTPSAIVTALAALGWTNVTLQEGQDSWGGSSWASDQGWAVFRVVIQLPANQAVPAGLPDRTTNAVMFWKNARSWLDSIQFIAPPIVDVLSPAPTDSLINIFAQVDVLSPAPTDRITAPFAPIADLKTIAPRYDQRYYHSGITYGANEPSIVDSGVRVNGQAISQG